MFRLYMKYFMINLKSTMQYKSSFLFISIGQFLVSFNAFLAIYFMFDRFHQVKGYTFQEVLLCYSIVLMSYGISECFFRGFDTFRTMISNGVFDRIMLRPRGLVFQVISTRIEFTKCGRLLQALLVFIYTLPRCGIVWTFDKILLLIFMILCGTLMFCGIYILYAGLTFFTLSGLEFFNVFTDGSKQFCAYPLDIYGKGILKFATFVIPYACFLYYPFLYLIGKTTSFMSFVYPCFSALFVVPCYLVWRYGLRHYKSTGS